MIRRSILDWANVLLFAFAAVLVCRPAAYAGFTDTGAALINVGKSAFAWGDYDNDGDLDLVIAGATGYDPNWNPSSKIYRNDGNGVFTDIGANLAAVFFPSVAWGDYDNDGDLDLALAGSCVGSPFAVNKIYRNDNGIFTDIGAPVSAVSNPCVSWADYDNDGDLDLAVSSYRGPLIIYRNDNGVFGARVIPGGFLAAAVGEEVAWGDYDNDGDLDFAIAGDAGSGGYRSRIYRNDNGTFTDIKAGLEGIQAGSLAWGDYDNDGDLDLAVSGLSGVYFSKIYRDDNGTFVDTGDFAPGAVFTSMAWGDYDNDGDLDLAVTGINNSAYVSSIYRNDNGVFTDAGANLTQLVGCAAWGDYDNDGDLDLAVTGFYYDTDYHFVTRLYRNDALVENTPPSAPTGLAAAVSASGVTFSWNAAADAQTPASGLSYNLRVGTAPGKDDIFSGMAGISSGARKIPALGNAQKRLSWTLTNSRPASSYYWSVQAVDTAYAGSPWAAEQSLPLNLHKISGHVRRPDGLGVAGVSLASGNVNIGATTDADGYYELWVIDSWAGSITPGKAETNFQPGSRIYSGVTSDQADQDYTCFTYAYIDRSGDTIAWGDYDNDGDLDLVIAGSSATAIYRNDDGSFVDSRIALPKLLYCSVAWGDYDNDGDLDLALAGATDGYPNYGPVSRIYRNNGNGSFTDIGANLVPVSYASLVWGDYDNDGDLDLALIGATGNTGSAHTGKVYRNDGGVFTDTGTSFGGVWDGALAWGDYDNDGDLDLAVTVRASDYATEIYRNDGGVFVDSGAAATGVDVSSLAWGDYDHDGDLDLALAGIESGGSTRVTRIYRNDGSGVFTDIGAGLDGVGSYSVGWGDYDNDGDLDLAGAGCSGGDYMSCVYRNDNGTFVEANFGLPSGAECNAVAWGDYDSDGDLDLAVAGWYDTRVYRNDLGGAANTPPSAPAGLTAATSADGVTFSWNAAADAQTPAPGLSYNLRVGTSPGKNDVFSGMADAATGRRKLPALGNAQKRLSWTLRNGKPGRYYYWSVQAIDSAYAASRWADEVVTTIDATPPVIASVAAGPSMVASGDRVHIAVNVTDNTSVASVAAEGSTLTKTGADAWEGEVPASAVVGAHQVTVVATDAAGNSATDTSASYRTAKIIGASCAGADIMQNACANYLFRFWGRVSVIDSQSFWLSNGARTRIEVIAPGYAGVADGDYAAARGILDPNSNPPKLICPAAVVQRLQAR